MELRAETEAELKRAGRHDGRICQACGSWFSPDPGVAAFCCVCTSTDEHLAENGLLRETYGRLEDVDRTLAGMQKAGLPPKLILKVGGLRDQLNAMLVALAAGTYDAADEGTWPAEPIWTEVYTTTSAAIGVMRTHKGQMVRFKLADVVMVDWRWIEAPGNGYGELRFWRADGHNDPASPTTFHTERHTGLVSAAYSIEEMQRAAKGEPK